MVNRDQTEFYGKFGVRIRSKSVIFYRIFSRVDQYKKDVNYLNFILVRLNITDLDRTKFIIKFGLVLNSAKLLYIYPR